mgnify:CR=1 FL=1
MINTTKTISIKDLIENFKQKTNDILEYTSFMKMSNDRKYLKIDELVRNLKNMKKQIKINKNNELFIDYLMMKWTTDFSNLSFKQTAEIDMYKEKCSTTSSSTMLEKINVEAISKFGEIPFFYFETLSSLLLEFLVLHHTNDHNISKPQLCEV